MARILAVDDSRTAQHYIKTILLKGGHNVLSCYDGGQAMDIARNRKPHVILLDIMLPNSCGSRIARQFARDVVLRRIPIVMVSGQQDRQLILQLMKLPNVCGYVVKAFTTGSLSEKVNTALELRYEMALAV